MHCLRMQGISTSPVMEYLFAGATNTMVGIVDVYGHFFLESDPLPAF